MNRLRAMFFFFCGTVVLALAAMMSRVVFSHGTFPPRLDFFLSSLGIYFILMMICFSLALILERFGGTRRLWSHIITTIILTALVVIYQVWSATLAHPFSDVMATLFLFFIINFVVLIVRRFGSGA